MKNTNTPLTAPNENRHSVPGFVNKGKRQITVYTDADRGSILAIWEKSVLATHHFLSSEDFESIKEMVKTIDFNAFDVYCLVNDVAMQGFIGIAAQKVEMLFVSPECFGNGIGKQLINFAITKFGVDKVDVNEQNINAVKFYEKLGFKVYERTDKDDQGKDYPLLRMKIGAV